MICRSIKSSKRKRKRATPSRLKVPVLSQMLWEDEPGEDFFPRPLDSFTPNAKLSALAEDLWDTWFERGWRPPLIYITWNCPDKVDAHCTGWGIVINWANYKATPARRRRRWLSDVLKHELLHWAGYTHRQPFGRYLKYMGGSY